MPSVTFERVGKRYPDGTAGVVDLDLEVADGEFLCLLGPSGCGKSSTIRMLAGLETVSIGEIRSEGRRLNDVPPQDRDAAMVFENYALYPHLVAFENIAMPLRARAVAESEIRRRVTETATALRIADLLHRRPSQLSGGQRQRVAIGRAIVREPRFFLMDEPLGHLEAYLRVELRAEIRALQERLGVTTLYVTHDQEEAAALADRVAILERGRLQQVGTFPELLDRPANRFVAGFIGEPPMAFLKATRAAADRVRLADGSTVGLEGHREAGAGDAVELGIRAQDVRIGPVLDGAPVAEVAVVEPQGWHAILHLESPVGTLSAVVTDAPPPGTRIGLGFDPARLHLFDAATGARLRRLDER